MKSKSGILRVAQIGLGGFGERHLGCLFSEKGRSDFQLVATADVRLPENPQWRSALADAGIVHYTHYRDLLRSVPDLDAVVLVAPIPLHEEMIEACLDYDVHVLLEKPPVPTLEQLNRLLLRPGQERVAVGFQWIAAESIQRMKRWILEGRIGAIREIRGSACWPRSDTYYHRNRWVGKMTVDNKAVFDGPATNALAHLLHNIMFLGGNEPRTFMMPDWVEGELYRVRPGIESYDLVCLRGELESGAAYHVALTHACQELMPFVLEIRGDHGWIRLSRDGCLLESSWGRSLSFPPEGVATHLPLYADFARFCRGEVSQPLSSLEDTRGYLALTTGGLASSGGIHAVESRHRRTYEGEGGLIYAIPGTSTWLPAASRQMSLFSEMDLEWAVRGTKISLEELSSLAEISLQQV